ncbi:MAG: heparinase II/III family protein [Balneolales bacterium]
MNNLIRGTFFTVFTLLMFLSSYAQERYYERNLLTTKYERSDVAEALLPNAGWVPYPDYDDRSAWEALPGHLRQLYIDEGEKFLDHVWASVPAVSFLEYERTGNRQLQQSYQDEIEDPLRALFMAELFEGEGRFTDQIINGVWAMSEMSTWSMVAHLGSEVLPEVQRPHIDLRVAEYGQLLSWIHYFLEDEFDAINPVIARRIRYEINNRVLEPYYERNDFWWMGFEGSRIHRLNNWNPHCNGNILATILLMETEKGKKDEGVYKLMRSLENFVNCYPEDGGCDEGPSYWRMAGGSSFETLNLLSMATGGKVDIFDDPLIQNMGKYIYRVNISYPYFYNYSDGGARPNPTAYVVYTYGEKINDPEMMGFGAFLADKQDYGKRAFSGSPFVVLESLFNQENMLSYPPHQPMLRDFWLPDLQIMGARDREDSADGFYFAAKGGHNAPWNHNHNDVGSFILYYDGEPLVIDAGVQTYTADTFGAGRYGIWTMQSGYHNLPVINASMQREGRQYEATGVQYLPSDDIVKFSMDLADTYPEEALVDQWVRSYTFTREESLVIDDAYLLKEVEEPFYHSFLSLPEPVIAEPGLIEWTLKSGKTMTMEYGSDAFSAQIEIMEMTDRRLQNNWDERLYRIILTSRDNAVQGASTIVISD